MRRLFTTAICLAATLALCLTAVSIQQGPPQAPPPQNPPAAQNPPAQPPAAAEKSYLGQLAKVDANTKEITIKGADNKEMIFVYNDKTQMKGIDNAPQGLNAKTGSRVRITYEETRGSNVATRVELVPDK